MSKYKRLNINHLSFIVKIGDTLVSNLRCDALVTSTNVNKIINIDRKGYIYLECINSKCKLDSCTKPTRSEKEIKSIKIDNRYKSSKRLYLNGCY